MLWFLQFYAAEWEAQHAEENAAGPDGLPKKKRRKKEGKHKSTELLGEFIEVYARIKKARKDPVTGHGWDEAIMVEAEVQGASVVKTGFADHMPDGAVGAKKAEAKTFVMPLDDSDDEINIPVEEV